MKGDFIPTWSQLGSLYKRLLDRQVLAYGITLAPNACFLLPKETNSEPLGLPVRLAIYSSAALLLVAISQTMRLSPFSGTSHSAEKRRAQLQLENAEGIESDMADINVILGTLNNLPNEAIEQVYGAFFRRLKQAGMNSVEEKLEAENRSLSVLRFGTMLLIALYCLSMAVAYIFSLLRLFQ